MLLFRVNSLDPEDILKIVVSGSNIDGGWDELLDNRSRSVTDMRHQIAYHALALPTVPDFVRLNH